jgi:eukaryotic-like serine/threonine-protein kinase
VTEGLQIGEYVVEELIGAGGMGTVYRARAYNSGKKVAIKVLGGVLARDAVAIRRFVLEAKAVNDIGHPNLANVFSFGQLTDGRYYYAMEYLRGCSLGGVLRAQGRLRAQDVVPVFLDVLQALQAAHAKGVVHRDLKPDNVFLVRAPGGTGLRAKLLDFGLAKLVAGESPRNSAATPLTAAGMAVGTPKYMAPEQCKAHHVDARSDLYALGVMFYEALTGKVPCDGRSTIEIWEAHVKKVPIRPRVLAPDLVSPPVDALIMKLLAKDPADRFQSAKDVITVLAAHARSLPPSTLELPEEPSSGSSASDVARALPSSINSTYLVALDGAVAEHVAGLAAGAAGAGAAARASIATPPAADGGGPSSDGRGLRAALEPDLELAIEEPALETDNPAQASALNIDLGGLRNEPPPAWAASAARMSRPGPLVARSAKRQAAIASARKSGGLAKGVVVFLLAVAAAAALLIVGR